MYLLFDMGPSSAKIYKNIDISTRHYSTSTKISYNFDILLYAWGLRVAFLLLGIHLLTEKKYKSTPNKRE